MSNISQVNQAILDLDIDEVMRLRPGGPAISREGMLAGCHKLRLEMTAATDDQKRESAEWLRERGLRGYRGLPLPNGGL